MSTQPNDLPYDADAIEEAFAGTGWRSPDDGWFAYRLVGGTRKRDAYRDWVTGTREPRASDYAFLAYSINRRLEQRGKEPMLPELPLRRPHDADGHVTSDPGDGAMGGQPSPVATLRYLDPATAVA